MGHSHHQYAVILSQLVIIHIRFSNFHIGRRLLTNVEIIIYEGNAREQNLLI